MSRVLSILLLLAALLPPGNSETVTAIDVDPHVILFETSTGNVVASVGPDGAFLVGTPSAASTAQISTILAARTPNPQRYVVIFPQNPADPQADAGWGHRGAFVAMHENALRRLGGNNMGASSPGASRFPELGVERPRIAFSEVIAFNLNGDSIHVVHQPAGYSDADAIVHFHASHLIYMGEDFPGDGYPAIDLTQAGKLAGILRVLGSWTDPKMNIAPARGKVTTGAAVAQFRDMIVAVRDRIRPLVEASQTEAQVIATHPTAEFDAQWGHGRVTPEAFIQELYQSLKTP